MKKRFISMIMALALALTALQSVALAAAKQMNDNVPVWTEITVKDYMRRYARGEDVETLWGYFDLQIRRYMPLATYVTMLAEMEWITGGFVGFGTYFSFEEPERKTKTHVLHLCMDKQDMDVYFTHKNKADDWEVMAVEFVFAEKQDVNDFAFESAVSAPTYVEQEVVVGAEPYALKGILTFPSDASMVVPGPACVFVHDVGDLDKDASIGQTTLFADLARALAERGIASVRYDTRAYTYGAEMVEAEIIQDAIAAGKLLQAREYVNAKRIVLVGHGLGATLAPKIASQADGVFSAMMLIAGRPDTALAGYDVIKTIQKLKLPTYIVQGSDDFEVPTENGVDAFEDKLDSKLKFVEYKVHQGLNHLLMQYRGDATQRGTVQEYDTPAMVDTMAARELAAWIIGLWSGER